MRGDFQRNRQCSGGQGLLGGIQKHKQTNKKGAPLSPHKADPCILNPPDSLGKKAVDRDWLFCSTGTTVFSPTRQGTSGTASGVTQSDLEKDPGHSATKDQTCIGTDSDNGPNQPESADFFLKGT